MQQNRRWRNDWNAKRLFLSFLSLSLCKLWNNSLILRAINKKSSDNELCWFFVVCFICSLLNSAIEFAAWLDERLEPYLATEKKSLWIFSTIDLIWIKILIMSFATFYEMTVMAGLELRILLAKLNSRFGLKFRKIKQLR